MAAGNVAEVDIRFTYLGQEMENVYHVKYDDASWDVHQIATKFDATVGAKYKEILTEDGFYTVTHVRQVLVPGDTSPAAEADVNLHAGAGTRGGTVELPSTVCAAIHLKTGVARRGARGWNRMPPASTGAELGGGGLFDSGGAYMTKIGSLINDLLNTLPGGTVFDLDPNTGLVVYSRRETVIHDALSFYEVTSITTTPKMYWLRSRAAA